MQVMYVPACSFSWGCRGSWGRSIPTIANTISVTIYIDIVIINIINIIIYICVIAILPTCCCHCRTSGRGRKVSM